MSKWISVKERLPTSSAKYIACVRDRNDAKWTVCADWSCEMRSWFGEFGEIKNKVTHWMPLPDPPKEGQPVNEFPERLRRLREEKRKSRAVLSELCGLHTDAIRRYERGEAEPDLVSLIAIADYFEVSLDYLTGRTMYR